MSFRRSFRALVAFTIASLAMTSVAFAADSVLNDQDFAAPGNNNTIDAGAQTRGTEFSVEASLRIQYAGNQLHLAAGSTVVLQLDTGAQSTVGVTADDLTFSIPTTWTTGSYADPLGTSTISYTPALAESDGPHQLAVAFKCKSECVDTGPGNTQTLNNSGAKVFVDYSLSTVTPPSNSPPNVAGTISGSASVNEGAAGPYSISASDPDGDTLTYSWTIVSGNASITAGASLSTATVSFTDGPSTVDLQVVVSDGHGHSVQRNLSITEANLAPTATFGDDGPKDEGTAVTVSFTSPADASSIDAAAGFTYSFACDGSTFGVPSSTPSASCTFFDNGTPSIAGRIYDKDGDYRPYTTTASIVNVPPTITSLVWTASSVLGCGTDNAELQVNFSDPGTLDTHSASITWGDGSTAQSLASLVSGDKFLHTYGPGSYTAAVTVTDDDGGISSLSSAALSVLYNDSGILQPINANNTSVFKLGSVIPVKIQFTDCDGEPVDSLSPTIALRKVDSSPALEVTEAPPPAMATPGNTMRWSAEGLQYIFNLSTKRSEFNGGGDLTPGTYELKIYIGSVLQETVRFDIRK